jgi:uncharacterized protein YegL
MPDMTKATPSKTLVTLLLDRSNSMQEIKAQTVEAINDWLGELRKTEDNMRFSLIQFDNWVDEVKNPESEFPMPSGAIPASAAIGSRVQTTPFAPHLNINTGGLKLHTGEWGLQLEKTYVAVPVAEVPDLHFDDFMPRGGTPLIDAACTTIRAIEDSLEGREDVKVILAIQTDGNEMHSTQNTWADLKALVTQKEAAGWEIIFMGAGIDAYAQADRMGVSRDKTLSYGKSRDQTRSAFATTGAKSVMFASGAAQSMAYTSAEKTLAGDIG